MHTIQVLPRVFLFRSKNQNIYHPNETLKILVVQNSYCHSCNGHLEPFEKNQCFSNAQLFQPMRSKQVMWPFTGVNKSCTEVLTVIVAVGLEGMSATANFHVSLDSLQHDCDLHNLEAV